MCLKYVRGKKKIKKLDKEHEINMIRRAPYYRTKHVNLQWTHFVDIEMDKYWGRTDFQAYILFYLDLSQTKPTVS